MRDVPRWRDSDVYTDLERQVLLPQAESVVDGVSAPLITEFNAVATDASNVARITFQADGKEIRNFTGIDDPYEIPKTPAVVVHSDGREGPAGSAVVQQGGAGEFTIRCPALRRGHRYATHADPASEQPPFPISIPFPTPPPLPSAGGGCMIRSMTAFASGERSTRWGTIAAELRSVNHRVLELAVKDVAKSRQLLDVLGIDVKQQRVRRAGWPKPRRRPRPGRHGFTGSTGGIRCRPRKSQPENNCSAGQ